MTPSAFARFIQADPNVYRNRGETMDPRYINQQEQYAEVTGGMGQDYDYRMLRGRAANGHGGDLGKLPWHPTFSNQSAFTSQGRPGGVWGRNSFTPSKEQLGTPGYSTMIEHYMKNREPGVILDTRNQPKVRDNFFIPKKRQLTPEEMVLRQRGIAALSKSNFSKEPGLIDVSGMAALPFKSAFTGLKGIQLAKGKDLARKISYGKEMAKNKVDAKKFASALALVAENLRGLGSN